MDPASSTARRHFRSFGMYEQLEWNEEMRKNNRTEDERYEVE